MGDLADDDVTDEHVSKFLDKGLFDKGFFDGMAFILKEWTKKPYIELKVECIFKLILWFIR